MVTRVACNVSGWRHKGQWCGAVRFSLICAWTNGLPGDCFRLSNHYKNYNTAYVLLIHLSHELLRLTLMPWQPHCTLLWRLFSYCFWHVYCNHHLFDNFLRRNSHVYNNSLSPGRTWLWFQLCIVQCVVVITCMIIFHCFRWMAHDLTDD